VDASHSREAGVAVEEQEKAQQAAIQVPMATAPTVTVVTGGAKSDKSAGGQTARPMAGQMTLKDQEICNQTKICKWHAMYVDCKFGANCRGLHLSAEERKEIGLSFSAVSSETEAQTSNSSEEELMMLQARGRSEDGLMVDLLNDCCELTGTGPVNTESTARGDAFLNLFGAIGYFAIGELTRITEEEERIFHKGENATNMDEMEVSLPLALADNTMTEIHE